MQAAAGMPFHAHSSRIRVRQCIVAQKRSYAASMAFVYVRILTNSFRVLPAKHLISKKFPYSGVKSVGFFLGSLLAWTDGALDFGASWFTSLTVAFMALAR